MMLKKLQIISSPEKFERKFKSVIYGLLIVSLMFVLSGCGLITSKPPKVIEAEPLLEEVESKSPLKEAEASKEANLDVAAIHDIATIDKVIALKDAQSANVALRLLALEQNTQNVTLRKQSTQEHGYYWLDGIVKQIHTSDQTVQMVEVESIYDAERYIVTTTNTNASTDSGLLDNLVEGQFVYLDGFYDTFSGFIAVESYSSSDLLEAAIGNTKVARDGTVDASTIYDFGLIASTSKRKQVVEFTNNKAVSFNNDVSFFDAYSKQAISKNAFWQALSQEDTLFFIASSDSASSDDDGQINVNSVWLLDQQASKRAVIGTIKQVDNSDKQITLSSEMWLTKDNELSSQVAQVSLKLMRKSQLFNYDSKLLDDSAHEVLSRLAPGQQVIVEGVQKNNSLEVERLYLQGEKNLPVYAYGSVIGHKLKEKTIDITVEWMFGLEPSETLEVSVNGFTEMLEIGDDKATLSSTEFWNLLSLNDDIEVEGQVVGDTLQATRLFLGNKQLELQTLSGTVATIRNDQIALRLYSYTDSYADTNSFDPKELRALEQPSRDLISLELAYDVEVQDIHLAESIVVAEFLERLEPSDQLTITGYFDNNTFVTTIVKFEDADSTPFLFGEVEAFEKKSKQIMLKGQNQVVAIDNKTTIKHTSLGKLSTRTFWSKLNIGDNIDIEGSYQEGIFVAKKIFLSPKVIKDMKILEGEVLAFDTRKSSLQVKEVDGFVVSVDIAKDSVLLAKTGKIYNVKDFWNELAVGQQVSVEGERLGSIMQANYLTLNKTTPKKESLGIFDWLNM